MNEDDLIETLEGLLERSDGASAEEGVRISAEAVREFPASACLWYLRGMFLEKSNRPCAEVRACYEQALEIDPGHAEAAEELALVLDIYYDEFEVAEAFFRLALSLGCGEDSSLGLARVLAQLNRDEEALSVIYESASPSGLSEDADALRREILLGMWKR